MPKYILRFVFVLVPFVGLAQASIKGTVLDSEGTGIPGATIQVVGTPWATVSDASGSFNVEDIQPGPYVIVVRSMGFIQREEQVQVPLVSPLVLQMEENSLSMEEVVITGTMQPRFISQSPIKVEVTTSEYLNTFMPSAATGLVEGISLSNGIQEVVACGVCFTNSLSINGLPGPYTAILMDGTPIYGNLASVYGLNGIPSMIIDRLEVIKGPSSTLYGSEAVAGVINIITKDPADQPSVSFDVMGTSHMESFGNLAVAPRIGKSSGFVGLNYAYMNNFDDDNGDGFGDVIHMDRISLFSKWDLYRPSGKNWSLAGKYYYEDRRNGVESFLEDRNYRDLRGNDSIYGESIYTERWEVFGSYAFNTQSNVRLDYSLSTHNQDSYYGSDYYEANQQIVFGNLIWAEARGAHRLTIGLTQRLQRYDDNTVATRETTGRNNPDAQYIPGIFLQDEWEISDAVTVLAGSRLDHYQRHGFIFAPRLNTKWKIGNWTTLRSNFGTGFRIVNLFTEDHAFVTGQRDVVISEQLQPESSYNGSLNLNHVYNLGGGQGMLDIDAFYTYFTNKIVPDYETPGAIVYANTNGFAVSKGIGLNLAHDFGQPISLNVGLNYQEVTETEKFGGVEQTRDIEFSPAWSGVLTMSYQIQRFNMQLAYTAQFTGSMALPEVFDLDPSGTPLTVSRPLDSDAFQIHSMQVSKQWSRWKIYGGVQNIWDYRQPWSPLVGFNDPNAQPGFSGQFDTSYAFAPIHGREFYLGIAWQATN